MASCILYQNSDSTVILIDIPCSIELAQGTASQKLLSSKPIEHPFPSVEPKSEKARANLGTVSLEELLLQKHIQLSLDQLRSEWKGEWCLPRHRKQQDAKPQPLIEEPKILKSRPPEETFFTNSAPNSTIVSISSDHTSVRIPANSTALCGEIASTSQIFTTQAPKFDLILLDPPWPNRSARRKKSYGISYGNHEIRALLLSIPLANNIKDYGLVGVWVTNKSAFREMLLDDGGLFQQWGVQLVEEWIWLKVTPSGEPISELSSLWRKPYEILLVGRKGDIGDGHVKRRVLVGVPDLHSRKPNLKSVFEEVMKKEKYEALEIFARNLTAGWWGWGNEVLKFQSKEYWMEQH
ncbi:MT-A70-domain-containing protein [Stipitochalara longipes BDJ]|nr:MT-A70-domain-containing protein [Stipitochalara longipes BDJ]